MLAIFVPTDNLNNMHGITIDENGNLKDEGDAFDGYNKNIPAFMQIPDYGDEQGEFACTITTYLSRDDFDVKDVSVYNGTDPDRVKVGSVKDGTTGVLLYKTPSYVYFKNSDVEGWFSWVFIKELRG